MNDDARERELELTRKQLEICKQMCRDLAALVGGFLDSAPPHANVERARQLLGRIDKALSERELT